MKPSSKEGVMKKIIISELNSYQSFKENFQSLDSKKATNLYGELSIDNQIKIMGFFQNTLHKNNETKNYLDCSIFKLAKNRFAWLLVLMISATLSESIINRYEYIFQSMIILASAIPMLMDTGGNAGSQSSTIIIRGMALGEIQLKDYKKVLCKELGISIIVGFALGVSNLCRMFFLLKNPINISILVSITLSLTIVLAKLIGGILPMGAKKLKLDPAIMAGPLVTTIVDSLTLIIYFYLAMLLLKI